MALLVLAVFRQERLIVFECFDYDRVSDQETRNKDR